ELAADHPRALAVLEDEEALGEPDRLGVRVGAGLGGRLLLLHAEREAEERRHVADVVDVEGHAVDRAQVAGEIDLEERRVGGLAAHRQRDGGDADRRRQPLGEDRDDLAGARARRGQDAGDRGAAAGARDDRVGALLDVELRVDLVPVRGGHVLAVAAHVLERGLAEPGPIQHLVDAELAELRPHRGLLRRSGNTAWPAATMVEPLLMIAAIAGLMNPSAPAAMAAALGARTSCSISLTRFMAPSATPKTAGNRSRPPSRRTTSAVSSATSVPPWSEMPTSATASAGASLIPSPTIATLRPSALSRRMTFALSSGRTSAIASSMPTVRAIASTGARASPASR